MLHPVAGVEEEGSIPQKFDFFQELNSGSPGCPCHTVTLTTRPHRLVIAAQISKFKLEQTSSCQSYKKSIFAGIDATFWTEIFFAPKFQIHFQTLRI
jgi:hypothetical protein